VSGFGRVLVVGAGGQAGRELQRSFAGSGELICFERKDVDLADSARLRELVRATEPDLILNAAAYTAVDRAESEQAVAMVINREAPRVLAEEALRRDILLVHYSTDYVFDGTKQGAWVEIDSPNPLNVYGTSKLAGEQAIRHSNCKHLIFRTSWVYGSEGKNFLLTMLRLGQERDLLRIVNDQIGAPTSAIEIATATRSIVERALSGACGSPTDWTGLYHFTCGGQASWCEFARTIFAVCPDGMLNGRKPSVEAITSAEFPTPAARPKNSVLSNEKLRARFGVELSHWEEGLRNVFVHWRK
jgi:dTDP-4-dehydrorhamnose reductase